MEPNYETNNVWEWLENEEYYYGFFQYLLDHETKDKKVARLLKDFVVEIFIDFGKFGDLTSMRQLEKVDWLHIVKTNRD